MIYIAEGRRIAAPLVCIGGDWMTEKQYAEEVVEEETTVLVNGELVKVHNAAKGEEKPE